MTGESGVAPPARSAFVRWGWRALLGGLGLLVVAYLVKSVGPERVGQVLWSAGWCLPFVLILEGVQITCDAFALRTIIEGAAKEVPLRTWVRSSAAAYALMIIAPAGRGAGEIARGVLLARYVGAARATRAGTLLQAAYLAANGILSCVACAVVSLRYGIESLLALLLAANALLMAVIAAALFAMASNARLGRWLVRLHRRLARRGEDTPLAEPQSRPAIPWRATLLSVLGRSAQVVQYGVVLVAVGGAASPEGALMANGIHLVGATLGDVVPNQLGVVDGAYLEFSNALGFADEPARALAIAFVPRIAQLGMAAVCVVVAAATRGLVATERAVTEAAPTRVAR